MHIFLDTTVLRSDFYLGSPDARLLQQFIRTTRSTLAIPLVVIEETKNKFREELERSAVEINKLSRLLPANSHQLPVLDINAQVQHYESQLLKRLTSDFKFRTLDFPE
ncbi:MAG TPA: PIN domain-containing protein, partial [Candidatus Angelobacter sp.]